MKKIENSFIRMRRFIIGLIIITFVFIIGCGVVGEKSPNAWDDAKKNGYKVLPSDETNKDSLIYAN